MTNNIDSANPTPSASTWQLNALTEALGELTLTVDDSLSIGRGSDNDVVLGSKQVSRNHAVLSVLDGQLYVKDLDSSNGTFINDQRIEGNQSSLLQVDDTIGFASFSFLVNAPVAVEEVESLAPVAAENATGSMNTADDSNTEAAVTETTTKADEFEEYIIEHPAIDEPVVKETGIEDMLPATDDKVETVPVDTDSEVAVESTNEASDTSVPTDNATETVEPAPQEPIVKETGIEEVLSAAESVESAPVEDTPELVVEETLEEPVVAEEPVIEEVAEPQKIVATEPESPVVDESEPLVEQSAVHEKAMHEEVIHEETVDEDVVNEEPVVEAEHDKTTTTELQEEADPDVLRAKQAATSQFSGTANLGQSRDLGTEGNNAASQAVNNPANAGHIEKKPSGGWFIWVFVAILIVGLALWLFNKGVV